MTSASPAEVPAPNRPVAEGLFGGPAADPRLLAGRCADCGTWMFPKSESCPACSGEHIEVAPLPREGRLWSFTVQRFRPKAPYDGPEDFAPYGVGYVEFEGKVLVEGLLTENDPDRLTIGAPVEVCLVPYTTGPDGEQVVTFAFRPLNS